MPEKLKSLLQLKKIVQQLKNRNKKVVITNGCFDIIHRGHIKIFRKAKSLGDVLIVALNSDDSIRRLKGKNRPIMNQEERVEVLSELESIDFIVIFDQDTPENVIKTLKPDILVKGSDYKIEEIVGREYVEKVVRVPLIKGLSTTQIIRRIQQAYGQP